MPLFTKRLANGLGLAEDPSRGMSFGQHRCRLTAQALWRSFARGDADRNSRADSVASAFHREGLDPLRSPHRVLEVPRYAAMEEFFNVLGERGVTIVSKDEARRLGVAFADMIRSTGAVGSASMGDPVVRVG